ncbi:MAG: hypothetical protein CME67_06730 [Halobacteriovoraceae bacterium]|mgnify:FL=1|nr:hypothetical protein [Peredibacter sp.]MBJ00910.1 hypothetical protein [Halobacteriovoraceae bacterium]
MKLMLAALLSLTSVFAVTEKTIEKKFRINSRTDFGARVFYNCDSVEDRTYDILEELGATDIEVRCTGGIDRFGNYAREAYVKTTYTVQTSEEQGSFQDFKIRSFNSCHLYDSIFTNVMDSFTFEEMSDLRRCVSSRSRFIVSGTVLK